MLPSGHQTADVCSKRQTTQGANQNLISLLFSVYNIDIYIDSICTVQTTPVTNARPARACAGDEYKVPKQRIHQCEYGGTSHAVQQQR